MTCSLLVPQRSEVRTVNYTRESWWHICERLCPTVTNGFQAAVFTLQLHKLISKCWVGFNSFTLCVLLCLFLVLGRLQSQRETGNEENKRLKDKVERTASCTPTLTHSHLLWCINEHPYFLPFWLQCNVQFNGLMFRNGYFMCPDLLCI